VLGLDPKDFKDYHTYEANRDRLERAQRVAVNIYDALISLTDRVEEDSMLDLELIRLVQNSVQIGYEAALGLPHKASDYDITPETLLYFPARCVFCKHRFTKDGNEMECALEWDNKPCKIEVKEFID
jgi:hypothetical protein